MSIVSVASAAAAASAPSRLAGGAGLEPVWPFLALAVLVGAAAAFGLVKLRERRTRGRERELESLVASRTAELGAANAKLELLVTTDNLTGIVNRRAFEDALDAELRRASRSPGESSLLLLELDRFPEYTTANGDGAGNQCLRSVARVLAGIVSRAGDLVARLDGHRFAILLPSTDHRGTAILAERARRAVEGLAIPYEGSEAGLVTISVGAASLFALRGRGAEVLMGRAEEALYRAMTAGGNRSATDQIADPQPALRLVAATAR